MPIMIDPNEWNSTVQNLRATDHTDYEILYSMRDRFRWHGMVDKLMDSGHTPTDILSALGQRISGPNPQGLPDPELNLPSRYSPIDYVPGPSPFDQEKQNRLNRWEAENAGILGAPNRIGGPPKELYDNIEALTTLRSPDQLTTSDGYGESDFEWSQLSRREQVAKQSLITPWVDPVMAGVGAFGSGTVVALNSGEALLSAAVKGLSKIVPAALSDIPIGVVVSEFEKATNSPLMAIVLNIGLGAYWGRKVNPSQKNIIKDRLNKLFKEKGANVQPEDLENIFQPVGSKRMQTDFQRDFNKLLGDRAVAKYHNQVLAERIRNMISATVGEKRFGKASKEIDDLLHIFIDSHNSPEKIAKVYANLKPEQKAIIDSFNKVQAEHGFIANRISQRYSTIHQAEQDAGIEYEAVENYVSRLFKPFKGTVSTKHRKYDTIVEAWADGHELKITSAVDAMEARGEASIDAIHNRRLIDHFATMKDANGDYIISFTKREGYEKADFHGFKLWNTFNTEPIEIAGTRIRNVITGETQGLNKSSLKLLKKASKALQRRGFTEVEAESAIFKIAGSSKEDIPTVLKSIQEDTIRKGKNVMLLKKDLYVKSENYKRLDALFGVSKLYGVPGIAEMTRLNSLLKSIRFMTSFFHGNSFIRSFYFGGSPIKGVVQDIKAGEGFLPSLMKLSPRGAMRAGRQAWMNMDPTVELLIRNGLTTDILQDWNDKLLRQETGRIGQMLDQLKATKYAKDSVLNLRNKWNDFIFKEIGGPLKIRMAMIELQSLKAKYPNMDLNRAAELVATFANDDFGGLNLARLGISPTTWHGLRLISLAPDWNLSNIRTIVNATNAGIDGELYRHFWARSISKIAMLNLAVGAVLAASNGENSIDNYSKAWKGGKLRWADIDITSLYKLTGGTEDARLYFSSAGHFKDPIKYAAAMTRSLFPDKDKNHIPDLGQTLEHKSSFLYKAIAEFLGGEDWMGREFTTFEELRATGSTTRPAYTELAYGIPKSGLVERTPSFILNRLKGSVPIPVENLLKWWDGEMDGFYAVMNGVGAQVSAEPYYTPDRKREQKELRRELKKLYRGRGLK